MGRKRPTLGILLELLIKAELFRAADYVACNILKRKVYSNTTIIHVMYLIINNHLFTFSGETKETR